MIDLDGITGRVVSLPIPPGTIQDLTARQRGADRLPPPRGLSGRDRGRGAGKPSLRRFDLKTREEETLAEGIDDFRVSADGKKVLYQVGDPRGHASARCAAPRLGSGNRGRWQVQQGGRCA